LFTRIGVMAVTGQFDMSAEPTAASPAADMADASRNPAREPTDAQLVKRAQAGDHRSLGALLRRHERRLFNVALGLLGNREDALDATQDAYVSVVRALPSFRGEAAATTWMTRIVINAARDQLRKQRRRPAQPFSQMGSGEGSTASSDGLESRELSPTRRIEQEETAARLRRAVASLDDTFREVLVLRDFDEMEYADIAATLALPLGTVKSRLFRARLMLRDRLREHEDSNADER
jgi:RNA polymerase sigma-70 factor (ECF subfamily)